MGVTYDQPSSLTGTCRNPNLLYWVQTHSDLIAATEFDHALENVERLRVATKVVSTPYHLSTFQHDRKQEAFYCMCRLT